VGLFERDVVVTLFGDGVPALRRHPTSGSTGSGPQAWPADSGSMLDRRPPAGVSSAAPMLTFRRKEGIFPSQRRQVGSDARARRTGFPCSDQQGNCRSALQSLLT
jgi:hypothetical protein